MGDALFKRPAGGLLEGSHRSAGLDSGPPPSIGSAYAPGDRIADRYQLIRLLDQGGMGVVWIAHHLALDVHVALKLVRPDAGSEQAAARLVLEAQAAARLSHPAILRVLDVGKTGAGDPFLVMELLDGEALAEVLDRERRLDAVTAVRTILPIADALAALHERGIVHRDVKPENIFLARCDSGRWQPKLIDFGVAKLEQPVAKRITRKGMAVGTPNYMSPEQLQGQETDPRSDVWALSVVLYETLTGALPFEAEAAVDLLMAMLGNDPTPLAAFGVGDEELWGIVRRGLEPKEKRWPSVRALGKALARWLWAREVAHDVAGVALRQGWLDEDDVRAPARVPAAEPDPFARTTSVSVRPRARAPATKELAPRPSSTPAALTTPARATEPGPGAARSADEGEAGRPRRRFVPGAVAALVTVTGVASVAWLGRAPTVASGTGETPVPVLVAAPPTATPATATASAPSVPAVPAVPAVPSATTSASAIPAPRTRPRSQPAALPRELKDPFR